MSEDRIAKVRITGKVQGVGFRFWLAREAMNAGLEGWVRNRADRSVEAVLTGPSEAVEAVIKACWRGPPKAGVNGVEVRLAQAKLLELRGAGVPFDVLPTE